MTLYKCSKCKKTVERDSDKKWIESYCSETGKDSRLILTQRLSIDKAAKIFLKAASKVTTFDNEQEKNDWLLDVISKFKKEAKKTIH